MDRARSGLRLLAAVVTSQVWEVLELDEEVLVIFGYQRQLSAKSEVVRRHVSRAVADALAAD